MVRVSNPTFLSVEGSSINLLAVDTKRRISRRCNWWERGTRTLDLGIMTFAMLVGVQPARRFTIAVAQRELPDAFFGSASWTRTCRDFGP